MRIYIDFDDVISETARTICQILKNLYGKTVAYGDLFAFDLMTSFNVTKEEIDVIFRAAHSPEWILSYPETPFAGEVIREWIKEGHFIQIVTGRPAFTHEASLEWLRAHDLGMVDLIHVDKFGREPAQNGGPRALTPLEFSAFEYDFAVEDSPMAFELLAAKENCSVAVFSRPWNNACALPSERFKRCTGWKEVANMAKIVAREREYSF